MPYRWLMSLLFVMCWGSLSEPLRGEDQSHSHQPTFQTIVETETTAKLLAILLDSGRNVVNENQHLINDPEKGDKGFTPEIFEQQLMEIFWQRSGINLQELGEEHIPEQAMALLPKLVEMSKQVIDEGQTEINQKGLGFKGFIPAVFGARVAGRFFAATDVLLGQRALVPRNPSNLPDPFERAALLEFADLAYPKEKIISEVAADNHWLRLMLPLYTTRGCLDCHGQPKGELDKTGYPREGLQLGQNAGGISVLIPVQE